MSEDMLDLRSDAQREAEDAQKREAALYLDDLRHVLGQPEGRRVFFRLLLDLGFCVPLYQKSADVYAATARHDVAVLIMGDIGRASPEAFHDLTSMHIQRHYHRED